VTHQTAEIAPPGQVNRKICGMILLLKGEGGPKGRMRGNYRTILPLTRRPSRDGRHPLPSGEGRAKTGVYFWVSAESQTRCGSTTISHSQFGQASLARRGDRSAAWCVRYGIAL